MAIHGLFCTVLEPLAATWYAVSCFCWVLAGFVGWLRTIPSAAHLCYGAVAWYVHLRYHGSVVRAAGCAIAWALLPSVCRTVLATRACLLDTTRGHRGLRLV